MWQRDGHEAPGILNNYSTFESVPTSFSPTDMWYISTKSIGIRGQQNPHSFEEVPKRKPPSSMPSMQQMASRAFCVTFKNHKKFRALAVPFSVPQQPNSGLGRLMFGVSKSHAQFVCSERVISQSQMPLPTQ
jgi:hypothetical protein